MIYDHISQIEQYVNLHPNFAGALAYLQTQDYKNMPVGHYDTGDPNITFEIKEYRTTPEIAEKLVAHRQYCEIWIQLCSCEIGKFAFTEQCQVITPYQAETDALTCKSAAHRMIHLAEDEFVLLMPSDAHSHEIVGNNTVVKKAILRFRL